MTRRRKWLRAGLALLLLGGVAVAALLVWQRPDRPPTPEPPAVSLDGADPEVAAAVRRAQEDVRKEPGSATAWGRLGQLLLANEYTEEAVECLTRAADLDGSDPRWPYLRGVALFTRDSDAALPHLRRAADLADEHDPKNLGARLVLAEAYLTLRQTDAAEDQLERAARKGPNNRRLRFDRGVLASVRGNWQESQELLAPFADYPPVRRRACAQLALVWAHLGNKEKAAEYERRARTAPPDVGWADPYAGEVAVGRQADFEMVQQRLEKEGLPGAIAQLEQMAAKGDVDGVIHYELGVNLREARRYAEAETALATSAERGPDKFRALDALAATRQMHAAALARAGQADRARAKREEALAAAREAVAVKPNDADGQMLLGRCLLALGRAEDAVVPLRIAVACRPEAVATHLTLGKALLACGRPSEARPCLERAALLAGDADAEVNAALKELREVEKAAPRPRR
jgi:tetratricopeptide (TPR) repeat protein